MRNPLRFLPIAAIALFSAAIMTAAPEKAPESHDEAYTRNINVFNALTRELEENYVDSIRTDEAFKAAIRGMLETVDPYTEYYSYDDKEALERLTTGAWGGIGAYITGKNGNTFISEPIVNSPAMKAGLLPGDKIIRVDSVNVVGKTTDETTRLLRGQPGTPVEVDIVRPYVGADSLRHILLTREKVSEPSVPFHGVIRGNIGYVRLNQYIESSAADVKKALIEFQNNPEVKYLVLDLRGNGGGLVESAIEILGYFLPKGTEVLRTRGKDPDDEKVYKTQHKPILPDIPLAVLIDGGSASASEITAGALQDLDRAVLIGTQSFGKGLVQGTRPLPYNGLLKVTLAKYYTPSGRLIQALDYSRRNADGSVARTPDSLTHAFRTLNGREVRDGGGLRPDSTVSWGNSSVLIAGLIADQHIFNFANKYAATHPAPADIDDFSLSDAEFADFANSVDPKNFKYDKICSQIITQLKEVAQIEGYMTPDVKASIDSLEAKLDHDLKSDIYTKRDKIEEYITEEIAARYVPGSGRPRRELKNDPAIGMAVKIFSTPGLYNQILNKKK